VGTDPTTRVAEGTQLLLDAVDGLTDARLDEACALPGWTRRHLLAHVAANAEALGRLASWAATGVETPMYASPEQRDADIATGAARPPAQLRARLRTTAAALASALDALSPQARRALVRTAQGRLRRAEELPWMRAREVWIHAVDLGTGLTFDRLPAAFCHRLVDEIAGLRAERGTGPALELEAPGAGAWTVAGRGRPHRVELPLPELAAWLAGRAAPDGAPALPPWL
jgi:maleylpyruvate isomerase